MIKKALRIFISFTVILTSFVGCGKPDSTPVAPVKDFKVVAYIRGDYIQSEDSINSEDFDIITHIILFECASFDSKGNVVLEKEKLQTALKNIRNAVGERDVSITLNLLGPRGTTDSDVWEDQMKAQSDEHNKAFKSGVLEKNIVAVLDEYNFDGVHFDYEYPLSSKAWRHYNRFLVSLDEQLGDYTLGVAGVDWNIKFTKKAERAIDTFELMAYDFVDENGKHATLEDTVSLLENADFGGIAREKINVGIPFYSRPTDMDALWYGYNSYFDSIDSNGWYHCDETDKDFWFNTPEVVKNKTEYAKQNGYGGVMVWHYSCDLPSSEEGSLFKAINEATSE